MTGPVALFIPHLPTLQAMFQGSLIILNDDKESETSTFEKHSAIAPFLSVSLNSLHSAIPPFIPLSFTFSTQTVKSVYPLRSSLRPCSVSIFPSHPRMQQSLGPFKHVTSDRLDEALSRSVDLSFQRTAVTL